jgi:type 1 glutamine amidotransferase
MRLIIVILILFFNSSSFSAQEKPKNVLIFSKTEAFRHSSISKGKDFFSDMGKKNHWEMTFSENSELFSDKSLANYDVIVFLNTTGNILNDNEQEALKGYLESGKGFVGIHSAAYTEVDWKWYTNMIGTSLDTHVKEINAELSARLDTKHPALEGWNEKEVFFTEWYNFKQPIGKHINILTTLNEDSYKGLKMNSSHPISWYHLYDGGKVFYTELGHSEATYDDLRFYNHIQGALQWVLGIKGIDDSDKGLWTSLLSEDLHENWDVFIGAPHATVKDLNGVDPDSDGKNYKPLGLNNDPKQVFSLKKMDDEQVLCISGEIYGAVISKKEFKNYHLKVQFKWGEKVWEPRLTRERDNGILYHSVGAYGSFWNVWMQSQEFQVQEGDMGDYYALVGTSIDIPSIKKEGAKEFDYVHGGKLNMFSSTDKNFQVHCNKGFNNENPHGEWNTLELICFEGTSLHVVNGKVVMALFNSRHKNIDGQIVPLHKGRIQIQSEGAEAYYKNIMIKTIDEIPDKFKTLIETEQ